MHTLIASYLFACMSALNDVDDHVNPKRLKPQLSHKPNLDSSIYFVNQIAG